MGKRAFVLRTLPSTGIWFPPSRPVMFSRMKAKRPASAMELNVERSMRTRELVKWLLKVGCNNHVTCTDQ